MMRGIRSGDLACRHGGDEFARLLIGTTAAEARARFAQRLAQGCVGQDPGAADAALHAATWPAAPRRRRRC